MNTKGKYGKGVAACLLLAWAGTVTAAPVYWTDWTAATAGHPDTVIGTITGAGPGAVGVTYTGDYAFTNVTGTGTNNWSPAGTYADGSIVDNGPNRKDIIGLREGDGAVHTLTFSQPVVDPVMAIVGLGKPGVPVTYDFDTPFDVITTGAGRLGNGPLSELPGDVLQGQEGHGTIQFQGTFSEIHWTISKPEYWNGFTVGIAGLGEENGDDGDDDGDEEPGPASVPAPGALLLGSIGAGLIGYLRRRSAL